MSEQNAHSGETATIALFRDATEILFAVADRRRGTDPTVPLVPRRHFVKDADEAHRIALEGPNPIVGMSLDDLLDCAGSGHANAGQLAAFAGVHRGFLTLMAAPGIARAADLKGRRVAVDTDTGYASALFEMLRQEGLERGRDYEVVYAGATNLRFEKLVRGEFDATLLGAPFTRLALLQGYAALGTVIGALGGYQAIVLAARRPWLRENGETAHKVASCLTQTLAWATAPANRVALEGFLGEIFPDLDSAAVRAVAEDMFGAGSEFLADGRMRGEDMKVVIDLFNASRGASLTLQAVAGLVGCKPWSLSASKKRERPRGSEQAHSFASISLYWRRVSVHEVNISYALEIMPAK
ncbi:ABC transporter substrate-binding protein [Aquabacter sp. CN5-332]|uniref:ABC transporter substrate-binding protein n=1 Tax=Aquabacter sp. CN5-332 TaxID=3156608 RepID=UPI0032B4A793